jgi:V8-like Glu-specific endopeptidase
MKYLLLLLSFSLTVFAASVRESMLPVSTSSPSLIQEYATGVCSLGSNKTGTGCCTGFRVGPNKIMTNFHCLGCVSTLYKGLEASTPFMQRPSTFIYNIGNSSRAAREMVIGKVNQNEALREYNLTADDIPRNNDELRDLLNRFTDKMHNVNFNTYLGNTLLPDSALRIKSVLEANDILDYAIIEVDGMSPNIKTLIVKSNLVVEKKALAIIGHPHGGPNPDKKSFDITSKCRILNRRVESGSRTDVFSHQCDTLPGNSGSPIIDRNTGVVVGIHWGKQDSFGYNMAIDMTAIMADTDYVKLRR